MVVFFKLTSGGQLPDGSFDGLSFDRLLIETECR
jgi:hypothetical protein